MNFYQKSIIFCIFTVTALQAKETIPLYLCTAAGDAYFKNLLNLIGSLHHNNFDTLEELAVFDLGLNNEQKNYLEKVEKVKLYAVELTHPEILKPVKVNNYNKMVPGWYAWKPVIMKQALDMFDYALYVDAGTTILQSLEPLFYYIKEHGYFLTDCGHDIRWMTTKYLIDYFDLTNPKYQWILSPSTCGVAGSPRGLTRTICNNYLFPIYKLTKTMRAFVDDGSTPNGFGTGRHDQAIFSIMARKQNLTVHKQDNGDGHIIILPIGKEKIPVHITWNPKQVNHKTMIFSSRSYMPQFNFFTQCIRFKEGNTK